MSNSIELPTDTPVTQNGKVIIEHGQLEAFKEAVAKLNKKAVKFGLPPITFDIGEPTYYYKRYHQETSDITTWRLIKVTPESPAPLDAITVMTHHVKINYPIIKLGNWQLIAKVEKMDQGNLIWDATKGAINEKLLAPFQNCPISCQHCKTNRPRKSGFLLKNLTQPDDAPLMPVGTTCLDDFTGIDPAQALFLADMDGYFKESWGTEAFLERMQGGSGPSHIQTETFLTYALYCTEKTGFISSTKAKDTGCIATYQMAVDLYVDFGKYVNDKDRDQVRARLSTLEPRAKEIIQWAQSLETASNNFLTNLRLLLSEEHIELSPMHCALAASSIAAYDRELEKQRDRAGPKSHIANPGDKVDSTLRVIRTSSYETQYGYTFRITLRDQHNNWLTWKTSSPPAELMQVDKRGVPFDAKFKVKSHSTYEDIAQTEITHLKVLAWKQQEQRSTQDDDDPSECEEDIDDTSDRPRQRM